MSTPGAYRAGAEALAGITLPPLDAGLMLGRDRGAQPYVVRAFGPRPMLVSVLSGFWLARLVTFRAMALGARLVIHPALQPTWTGFAEAATGGRDRTVVLDAAGLAGLAGTPTHPIWYVGVGEERPPGPWQTTLAVIPQLSVGQVRLVLDADLVVASTLTPLEAGLAATALRLHPDHIGHLQSISGEMVAAFGGRSDHYLLLSVTSMEKGLFGPPTRD
ncbi:hypothetical protein [Actinoplanes philippinensis]|uniref:hypothetical protein n=1 Tax=Actinoplanes philippinensis TaxID=35752 RepID=UPI0033FFAEC8